MRHIPPLPSVRVFEAAARHENFTQAAAELGMTQAAVSYQIRLLEERLGVPLFVRSKRRVTLSEAGRRIAPLVSGAFDGLAEAFSGLVADDEGVLTISTAQTFATNWLGAPARRLPDRAARAGGAAAHLQRLVDFARDDFDVAVRMRPGPGRRSGSISCSGSTSLRCAAPNSATGTGSSGPEQLLRRAPAQPDDCWWKQWLEAAGVGAGRRGSPRRASGSIRR